MVYKGKKGNFVNMHILVNKKFKQKTFQHVFVKRIKLLKSFLHLL